MSGFASAGANILGSVLGYVGQQQTNAANAASVAASNRNAVDMSREQMNWSANQAQQLQGWQDNNTAIAYARTMDMMNNAQNFDNAQAVDQRAWAGDQAQRAMDFSGQQAQLAMANSNQQAANAMAFSSDQAARQMGFQWQSQQEAERYNTSMANTAYQRGTADLKAAGLNPILAAGGQVDPAASVGTQSGASGSSSMGQSFAGQGFQGSSGTPSSPLGSTHAPSGAMGQLPGLPTIRPATYESALGAAVSSGKQFADSANSIQSMVANVDNTRAETINKLKQGAAIDASAENTRQDTNLKILQAPNVTAEGKAIAARALASTAQAGLSDAQRGRVPSEIQSNQANSAASIAAGLKADQDVVDSRQGYKFGNVPGDVVGGQRAAVYLKDKLPAPQAAPANTGPPGPELYGPSNNFVKRMWDQLKSQLQ